MQPLDKNSFLELSLSEFVNSISTSVRLRNCILNASSAGICPFSTIKHYLVANELYPNKILRIPNLGKKTALELDRLIKDAAQNYDLKQDVLCESEKNTADNTDFMWKGKKLPAQAIEQNIYDLIQSCPTSIRINNVFATSFSDENFPCKTVKDILIGGEKISNKLLRYKNFGRTTLAELNLLVEQFLDEQTNNSKEFLTPKGLWQLMLDLLENLKPKEYKVLSCRYGFANNSVMTLEETGVSLGLTRERIRQIEQKTIKKLSIKTNKTQIYNTLLQDQIKIFASLSDSKGVIWKKKGMNRLPGEYRLAIDIAFGCFSAWIKSVAVEFNKGWLRSDLYTSNFIACQKKIKEIISSRKIPIPFEVVTDILEEEHQFAHLCASLLDGYYFFEGIIFSSLPGRRNQRQACLYRLLKKAVFKQIENLVEQYNSNYPSVQCSSRDAHIVMVEAPHLFLSLNDFGWTAIGLSVSDPAVESEEHFEPLDDENLDAIIDEATPTNLVSSVKQLIEENGPQHFVTLRKLFIDSFAYKYSQNSLGPVLITYTDFIRLAPGVYGLKKHVGSEMLSKNKNILMNYSDCTLYVISRWAGEPMLAYPWWTFEMEYAWCNWAQRHLGGPIFYSLMFIAEPNNWSVNDNERLYWLEIKKTKSHYSLQFPYKYSLSDCLPTLRDLYAIMVVTNSQSSMNWIRVNRILARRVDSQLAATYLATLIALGALQPNDHWQLSHQPGTNLRDLIKELSLHLCKQGDVPWDTDLGKSYLLNMENKNRYSSLGWVEKNEFKDLCDLLASKKPEGMKYIQDNAERGSIDYILKMMLDDKEKDDQFKKIGGLINELISDEYSER